MGLHYKQMQWGLGMIRLKFWCFICPFDVFVRSTDADLLIRFNQACFQSVEKLYLYTSIQYWLNLRMLLEWTGRWNKNHIVSLCEKKAYTVYDFLNLQSLYYLLLANEIVWSFVNAKLLRKSTESICTGL